MMSAWCVLMASRQLLSSWMALTSLTSLGDQRSDGASRVVSGVVVNLVLEGWQGVRGGQVSGSGVVDCLTVACWCFVGVSNGGVGGRLCDGLRVGVRGGGGSGPGSSGR